VATRWPATARPAAAVAGRPSDRRPRRRRRRRSTDRCSRGPA